MADNYLITGYWGEPHVTAENDRGIQAAIFGTGRFVLPVGEQFKAEYIGNNTIRMYDGKLIDNGAAAGIAAGEYVDLTIPEAGQGMKRNDLIVFQYEQDSSTLIESGRFVVVKGTETSGTPTDPSLTQADLLTNQAKFDQMAMWRVSVSGTTIAAPVKMFSTYMNPGDHISSKSNPHGVTKSQVGLGNVPNVATNDQTPTFTEAGTLAQLTSGEKLSVAFGKIAKAVTNLISHLSNKSNPHGVTASQVGARPNTWTPTASDVGLGNVPNVSTNNQTPTFTQATTLSQLTSGETLSALFGKVAKAITDLISHLSNKSNPHGVTAAQVGASATGHKHTKSEITDFPSSMPASDVYSWAKASSKPSYSWSEITSKPTTFTPSTHTHSASDINSGTLSSDRLPTVPVAKGGTGATTAANARTNLGIKSETWTLTYEDGTVETKVVYVG